MTISPQCKPPQVIHLGMPRTGTTTIQSVLKADARVVLAKDRYFQTAAYFAGEFPAPAPREGVVVLSDETMLRQSGNYVKMLLTLWRIRQRVPQTQIVLTIREQRGWLLSRYRYGVGTGTVAATFEQWLQSREGLDFLSLGHYGLVYRAIATYFPRENIHVLPFEWLRNDYAGFFQRLYKIIGLPAEIPPQGVHKNASLSDGRLACKRHCNRLALWPKSAFARPGLLHQLQSRLIRSLAEVIYRIRGEHSAIAQFAWPETKFCEALLGDFARSNRELIDLADIDLAPLGYCLDCAENVSHR